MELWQVDGPTHFASNTRRPLGPTLLKRRLLAARGWEVVSVPYFHWAELNTEFERQLYIHLALQVSLSAPLELNAICIECMQ